ncbi:hypothetical protein Vadar_009784 [Vaccinium darrowii]|uniref:Uncharacterized protein n=1 Tax=Vaccinium darrowii TaxID=229202 RepID=A0ACB7WZU5_9ERIC|nr:hypothetical protein Vadar_009784 [Vaccinium darrowii]
MSLEDNAPGTHFAGIRTTGSSTKFSGAGAYISLHNPHVDGNQYSAARVKLQNGPDSIETGWRVDPSLYDIQLGAIFDGVSIRGHDPVTTQIYIIRDEPNGNWWLELELEDGLVEVGFWPKGIFTGLGDLANYIEWAGETFSPPATTVPPMGSGFPIVGDTAYDAYFRQVSVLNEYGQTVDVDNAEGFADITVYGVKDLGNNRDPYFGLEWLTRSVVAKLKALTTPELVQNALRDFKFNDVVVKSLGGLKLIITFQTRADCATAMGNSIIVNWFNSFKPWNGEVAGESRLIWLKCRGMPLTVWNAVSFKRLSEIWRHFITLDVETLKEESYDVGRMLIATEHPQKIDDWINITVRGKNHRVKIWEEDCDDIYNENPVRHWMNKQHAEMRFFPISDHEVENGSCKMNNIVGDTLVIQPKEGSNSHVMAKVDNQQGKGIITNGDVAMDVSEAKNEDKAVMDSANDNVVESPWTRAMITFNKIWTWKDIILMKL